MDKQHSNTPRNRTGLRLALLSVIFIAAAFLMTVGAFFVARKLALAGGLSTFAEPNIHNVQATTSPIGATDNTSPLDNIPASVNATYDVPSLKPWDGAGRVTILLMGLDYRDWAEGRDYPRSDTMILLTLDPSAKTAGILSIPRDMWVPIPGFQHGKINTAYYLGEAYKLPGGGPALATKTVEEFLGVPINYYAQVDFQAFIRFIDEIGGIRIDVPEKITIDLLGAGGGTKTKKTLKPGRQTLPGEWALAYARARHTEGGDFDRAQRQQQVIMGIRDRILSFDLLPTIIQNAPAMYRELASGIHTNLNLENAIRLGLAAAEIREDQIQKGVLDERYVLFGFSPDNLSILVPLPDKINLLRDQIFSHDSSFLPATQGDIQERMAAESARLVVYNGSQAAGLEQRTADYLQSQGANIVKQGTSDQQFNATTIIDHTGNPYTVQFLAELIGNPYVKISSELDLSSPVDVEIYLGADWARNNSLP